MLGPSEKDIAVHTTCTTETATLKNLVPATKYYARVIVSLDISIYSAFDFNTTRRQTKSAQRRARSHVSIPSQQFLQLHGMLLPRLSAWTRYWRLPLIWDPVPVTMTIRLTAMMKAVRSRQLLHLQQ